MRAMHAGLLILRIGIGILILIFGWPKISAGVDRWRELGGAMGTLGITFAPVFWGFMAAFAEFVGGLALVLGVFVRPAAALLSITMFVAATMLIQNGSDFSRYAHPLGLLVVFAALLIAGGGHYGLGRIIRPLSGKWYQ